MLTIVMSYLVCNGVHLALTLMERMKLPVLSVEAMSDTVSICYMVSSAVRIVIYAKCNPKLRQEISDYVRDRKKLSTENDS
ncbi:hypothetical protein ANCDUO_02215 [Ancylostoma duodenale]|uniref:G-protein coupled receptors family 1 profile domain-containing protein n=1 Tax=Ancylostoma duodenale TaxID=51022 RepID=A0A0C2HD32_9BILA|nr:hypothetical protein ANCDUO_02215 [Ancylostoma duodenale]